MRQQHLLQILNIIVEDILDKGSTARDSKPRPKNSENATAEAFSKLQVRTAPDQLSLSDLIAYARDQKASLEDYLELLSSEPVVLAHDVNHWFFSRPELVPDEKGRTLPQHTDKYISGSVLDAVHSAVKGAAVWAYIDRLLERFGEIGADKVYRNIILQELSNICHFEFSRTQFLLKRHVAKTSKLFKRMSNAYDAAGNARLAMKAKPETFTRSDPQLHYILRLCDPDANAVRSVEWMRKLGELHQNYPAEREKLSEGEVDSLCNLAVVIGFIQDLSPTVSMPALSRKKGRYFVSQYQGLDLELKRLKDDVDLDLRDHAAPIDNLLEPGMAEGALKTLDQFIINKTGTKLGFLYQDLIEDSLSYLQNQYDEAKIKMEWTHQPLPDFPSEPEEDLVHQRKQKEKTRPSSSSTYEIAPEAKGVPALEPPAQKLKVSAGTAAVFTSIFRKSESRGSVSWAAFEGAMADLGFSVSPKFGSVFTFLPPETMEAKKQFTVHRPHKSKIEGRMLLFFVQRMKRVYGWDEETFEVA
ncbi:hypothetical protein ColLi_10953 [Colletotrichum liriopes]|uniref:Ipa protein n=1 Tax=Colletotrichum liriopes TaxID=708192 RepID=A0AA37GVN0_9PEZI|nr:hypothetical protein ColLi_10953 [Colletotrichum liriopes]